MTLLIKTIRFLGASSHTFEGVLFEPGRAYGAEDRFASSFLLPFSSLRRGTKILFVLYLLFSICISIFFINKLISSEYSLQGISQEIQKEEKIKNDLLARYAKAHSSDTILQAIERTSGPASAMLVSVETVKYLQSNAIVQANASR